MSGTKPRHRLSLLQWAFVTAGVWFVLFVILAVHYASQTFQIATPEGNRFLVDLFAGGYESWSKEEIFLASIFKAGCASIAGWFFTIATVVLWRAFREPTGSTAG